MQYKQNYRWPLYVAPGQKRPKFSHIVIIFCNAKVLGVDKSAHPETLLQLILANPTLKCPSADSQCLGGMAHMPLLFIQHGENYISLNIG